MVTTPENPYLAGLRLTGKKVVVVGGGNRQLKGGRHIRYPKDTPLNNLLLNLLDKVGVHADDFGDSTGRLPDV